MDSNTITALALRAAAATAGRGALDSDISQNLQKVASERAQALVVGNSDASAKDTQFQLQNAAIGLAIVGVVAAFSAATKHYEQVKAQRVAMEQAFTAHVAHFLVPNGVEKRELSVEQALIKRLIELSQSDTNIANYLGIHTAEMQDGDDEKWQFHSVLPYYSMVNPNSQPVASARPLDKQRTAIGLLFQSELLKMLSLIEREFYERSLAGDFCRAIVQGKRHFLNDLRAPRFIMMCLANLLWNLQHPVDPKTGFPLSIARCVACCRAAEHFLNQLLNKETNPSIHNIAKEENQLDSFVRKIEIHVKSLRAAYVEAQLNELNIQDVTNSAHHLLRVLDVNLLMLIYRRNDNRSKSGVPDDRAAVDLAYSVSYLNQLLTRNPRLIEVFQQYSQRIPLDTSANQPARTVIDLLIIFSHLTRDKRHRLLKDFAKAELDSAREMGVTLQRFDRQFLDPIRHAMATEFSALIKKNPKLIGRLSARCIMPLIALVIEDYRVPVDTEASYLAAKEQAAKTGKQQVLDINHQASLAVKNPAVEGGWSEHYYWAISPFIQMRSETEASMDEMPKYQYRMTQVTQLLDAVSEIVLTYRSFLQLPAFQQFLVNCLKKVKDEQAKLMTRVAEVESSLANDETISRSMNEILHPLMQELSQGLESFSQAMTHFERGVSAPDFTDQQRRLLSEKLAGIDQQYRGLFGEASGIDELALGGALPPAAVAQAMNHFDVAEPRVMASGQEVVWLLKLMRKCFDALSWQSKSGHKGELLRSLMSQIERKQQVTQDQVKSALFELVHITAGYRDTWFFQATYGQTRSAKALIKAIQDPDMNQILGVASILFGAPVANVQALSETEILFRLRSLRDLKQWEASANRIPTVTLTT